jgi:hypothetical protein
LQLVGTANEISGFWKSLHEDTEIIQCVFAVYPYKGMHYGRIICTYDEEGVMKDSIYRPKERAPGVVGNPYYCGLDLLWNLTESGSIFKGKIIDPEKGKTYNAEVWDDSSGNLIVRGKLLFFGRNITWYPISKEDFPAKFKLPDLSKFVPEIPVAN